MIIAEGNVPKNELMRIKKQKPKHNLDIIEIRQSLSLCSTGSEDNNNKYEIELDEYIPKENESKYENLGESGNNKIIENDDLIDNFDDILDKK